MASLNLGLIADTSIQLSNLESIVTKANFSVASALLTRIENLEHLPEVDVWVVRVDMEDERSQAFVDYLDSLDTPIIFDEADSYSSLNIEERARRFSKKIEACGIRPERQTSDLDRAQFVWVLAASAGGPEAVMEFLRSVPEELSNVAFVYVQHMDEGMAGALTKSISRNIDWQVHYCNTPKLVYEKSIYLVSPSHELDLNNVGMLTPSKNAWDSPYSPSVDHIVAKVWRAYGKYSGVIVFSGMGNDGAKTCRMIKNAGGKVWAQSLETCAVDSMPKEVMSTNCVSYIGTPEELAAHFANHHIKISSTLQENEYER